MSLLRLASSPRRPLQPSAHLRRLNSYSTAADRRAATHFAALLDSATHPHHLRQIHALLLATGLHQSHFLATKFVHSASRLGLADHARALFDEIPHPNVFLYNAIIRLYSHHNAFLDALLLYTRMLQDGVTPDGFTLPYVLKACAGLPAVTVGRAVHAHILRLGFESDVFVQNGLVSVYAKCSAIARARAIFDRMSDRNVVSWTSIASGCIQNGLPLEALRIFREMRKEPDVKPDFISFVSVVKAYSDVEDLGHGRAVHGLVVKVGLEEEPDLLIALTAMYAKFGLVHVARLLFDRVPCPSVILWNAMVSGYAKNDYACEAVELFREMTARKFKPDSITIRSAVSACAQVGSLEMARWMEDHINHSEFGDDIFVNTALIHMYAKCGSIAHARGLFDRIPSKDVVVWSAMIMGYGLQGCGWEAIDLFHEMQCVGIMPNDVTFLGLLSACNHAGLVEEGWKYFHSMKEYGVEPCHQHYACIVDLLSRAGHLEEAYQFVKSMPMEPLITVWGALLNACKIYGNVRLGECVAEHIFILDPLNAGHYVQLSNIYASAGMWNDVERVRVLMKERGVTKAIGFSLIEINGRLQSFRLGEKSHPRSKEIFTMLTELERKLKDSGLVPHTESILVDLNSEVMEESLCDHNEKLAIAYGLITTAPGTTLRITKNLRTCLKCHSATKLISKLVDREIVVRDANHFHRFRDGICSCGDYW